MKKDYRKILEDAARQMILIHSAETLIRLILRMIVKGIKVQHAGIFIYDKNRNEYVVKLSRGHAGFKIPSGFAKVTQDNALVRYFTDTSLPFNRNAIIWDKINNYLKSNKVKGHPDLKEFLENIKMNLSLYQARICVPGFFRKDLIGVLFLGEKKNKSKFVDDELGFLGVLASDVVMALKNAWLIEDLNHQIEINKRLFLQTVAALASSIEAKDKYTKGHTERVVKHSLAIAQNLHKKRTILNWDVFIENLKIAALLHDIGKIGIPEKILNKKTALTEKERKIIQQHPAIGAHILENIEELNEALQGVKFHHERCDGSGYPLHLKGRQIPLIASIVAIADSFDAMTINRPYSKALLIQEAVLEIKKCSGKQFVPSVVDAFLQIYEVKNNKQK